MNEIVDIDKYVAAQIYNNKWYRKVTMWLGGYIARTKLHRTYSYILCKTRLYTRYTDGRCHWCGDKIA